MIKKREDAVIKKLNDPTAFIEYSNIMNDLCNNIDDCNTKRKRKIVLIIDDMVPDGVTN